MPRIPIKAEGTYYQESTVAEECPDEHNPSQDGVPVAEGSVPTTAVVFEAPVPITSDTSGHLNPTVPAASDPSTPAEPSKHQHLVAHLSRRLREFPIKI